MQFHPIPHDRWVYSLLLAVLLGHGVASAAPAADEGPGPLSIAYEIPAAAQVTLNIRRPDGWVVRELVVNQPRTAGRHTEDWDGRDNHGRHCPPGAYQACLLTHEGIKQEYITSIGNSGTPPWKTVDGTGGWGGNHGQPVATAVDATGVYLGWTSTEGPWVIHKRTHDGAHGLWGIGLGAFEGVAALAVDQEFLYGVNSKRVMLIDPNTGGMLAYAPVSPSKPEDATPGPAEDPRSLSGTFRKSGVRGMAVSGRCVYVSMPWLDRIDVFEVTEKVEKERTKYQLEPRPDASIPLRRPRGLAFTPTGELLAVSGQQVFAVDRTKKVCTPLVRDGLVAPFAIAVDPQGTILVSDLGASQQIKAFTSAGSLQKTLGCEGGGLDLRAGGLFQEQDFRWPVSIAAGGDGTFWIAEDMIPKRIARFSTDGTLLYQGFGSVSCAAQAAPNPNDPAEVFSGMSGLFSGYVDYDKKTWRMGRILRPKWNGPSYDFNAGSRADVMLSHKGNTYMWSGPFSSKPCSGLYRVAENHLQPVMIFSQHHTKNEQIQQLARDRGADKLHTFWCDTNGDVAVQLDEIQFVPFDARGMAQDFTLLAKDKTWKPRGVSPQGVPLYDASDIQETPGAAMFRDSHGDFYQVAGLRSRSYAQGNGFWSARTSLNYLTRVGPDGPRWQIGQKATTAAKQGEIYHLWRVFGEMADCLFVTDVEGPVHLFHRDGFYVQSIMQDHRHDKVPSPFYLDVENFSGAVLEHPQTHKHYVYMSSAQATHVFELKGLASIKVHSPIPVTLPATRARWATMSKEHPYVIRQVPAFARPVTYGNSKGLLPRNHFDWRKEVPSLPLFVEGKLAGELRLAYSKKTLFASVDIYSDRLWTSRLRDDNLKYLRSTGDGIELLLGFDAAAAPDRDRAAPGDVGILSAGDGVAIYEPAAGGHAAKAVNLLSPDGAITLPHAIWTKRRTHVEPCPNGTGYQVEMAIPLELLGEALPGSLGGMAVRLGANLHRGEPTKFDRVTHAWHNASSQATDMKPRDWGWAVFEGVPAAVEAEVTSRATAPAPTIDGDPSDWTDGEWTPIAGQKGTAGRFKLAHDQDSLFAIVEVVDATPLKNAAGEEPLVIKGGDAVALCFSSAKSGDHAQKLVAARCQPLDADVLVNFRMKGEWRKPYRYASPVSWYQMHYVGPPQPRSPETRVALRPGKDGYTAEWSIPWRVIGVDPRSTDACRFDVQLLLSDETGSSNAEAAWWHSRSAESACTYDMPTEARLYPDEWGMLRIE